VDDDPEKKKNPVFPPSPAVQSSSPALAKTADDNRCATARPNTGQTRFVHCRENRSSEAVRDDAFGIVTELCELPSGGGGSIAGTPIVIRSAKSGPLALMFAESTSHRFDPTLDRFGWPNGDKDFSDAALVVTDRCRP